MNNELYHYGVLGMKWGVRRYQNKDGTLTEKGRKKYSSSKKIDDDTYLLQKKQKRSDFVNYELRKKNKKIGRVLIDEYKDHSHIDWIGVSEKERNKGYGQRVLDSVISDCVKRGKKYVTLDAAGLDPKARHIYEKKGFVAIQSIDSDVWNGLVVMKKDL